jgi:spore coat polysaccharide biosynthesis protein SpsF
MGSTRLPGKVLLDIGGETTLGRVVHRLSRAKLVTEVTIATTESPADDAIVSEAKRLRHSQRMWLCGLRRIVR